MSLRSSRLTKGTSYIVLTLGALCMAIPFFWMLINSLRPSGEITADPLGVMPRRVLREFQLDRTLKRVWGRTYDGSSVLLEGEDGVFTVDVESGAARPAGLPEGDIRGAAFSADNTTAAFVTGEGRLILTRDSREMEHTVDAKVLAARFNGFGGYLVLLTPGRLLFYHVGEGEVARAVDLPTSGEAGRWSPLLALDREDRYIAVCDGRRLLVIGYDSGRVERRFSVDAAPRRLLFTPRAAELLVEMKTGRLLTYTVMEPLPGEKRPDWPKRGSGLRWGGRDRLMYQRGDQLVVQDLTKDGGTERVSAKGAVGFFPGASGKTALIFYRDGSVKDKKIGGGYTVANYINIFRLQKRFGRYLLNSVIVSLLVVIGQIVLGSMAAYALPHIPFPGRKVLFTVIIGTMLVPAQVLVIPLFSVVNRMGLTDTYAGLVVPFLATGFAVFLFRQFFQSIPRSLVEASIIDGCNHLQIFRYIILPLSGPVAASVGIFAFLLSWNNFFWPLMAINSETQLYTIQVGLAALKDATGVGLVMAGAVISALPLLVAFMIAQEQFVQSLAGTGGKG